LTSDPIPTTASSLGGLVKLTLVTCLAVTFLQGCAGTAKGVRQSAYEYDESLTVTDNSDSHADAWVTLRYPAMIEERAEAAFFDAFKRRAFGGRLKADRLDGPQAERVALGMIAKSNYFAMSLYRELATQLPEDTVLLSPHVIYQDENGYLASRPVLATETIPSVLTIDFATYSFPDSQEMMNSPPLTFGDIVTPLAVVHSDHWMRPSTNGLLLASTPLVETSWQQSAELAREEFEGRLEFRRIDDRRSLDLVEFLNGRTDDELDVPTKSLNSPRRTVRAVESYPLEKIVLDGEIVGNLTHDHSVDPFEQDFTKGLGTRLEEALARIDHDRATFSDRQKLLAEFDPELAFAFMAQSRDESVRARLRLAEKLIAAERAFLAQQSRKIYEGVYEGSYGNSMREMLVTEYDALEQRRSLARRQNMQTALAILAVAASAYAGSQVWDGNGYDGAWDAASDLLMIGSFFALEASLSTRSLNRQAGENFLSQMAPALAEQVTVQVDLLEGQQEITARNHEELRTQTLALYQEAARSMTVDIETDCTFRHPEASTQGRWYGACFNGLATGRGYGVVRDDAGRSIEFIGQAAHGAAQGRGAMIVHSPELLGAVFLQGDFAAGKPHGVVRVETPGKAPQLRRFELGVDKGRAPDDAEVQLEFN
jgi:hypothetical protein